MIAELADALRGCRIAIDTEFVSERRYQALLCLVQVAVPDPDAPEGVRTEVLDPLEDELDPSPLAARARRPGGRGAGARRAPGRRDPAAQPGTRRSPTSSTRRSAAGFLGFGNQEGYESLVRKVLRVKLKGSEGFTKWDRRPLTAQQLEYAGDDARLLLALGEEMEQRLEERGRLEWAREECRALEEVRDERDAERSYERLPRLGRLSDAARAVARELVEWREEEARAADRPPGSVLPDQALIELARRDPARQATASSRSAACRRRRFTGAGTHCWRPSLAAASARPRPPPEPAPRDPADAPLVSLAQALVRHRSMESGVAVELIATQSELASLVHSLRRGTGSDHVRVATAGAASWSARS